jgi:hypothetical protein
MNETLKTDFMAKWKKYFNGAGLPLVFFYSDDESYAKFLRPTSARGSAASRCIIGLLGSALKGKIIAFSKETLECPGGERYSGYSQGFRPKFKYFLSYGIPGEMEGERYKKSPEIVEEAIRNMIQIIAPAKYLVFKRWDKVEAREEPAVVVFFAESDVLAELFTLANFRSASPSAVITPFSAGCGSIISYPFVEGESKNPRAVIGLFDPSARPYVGENILTFAAPMKKFAAMVSDMDESFLITPTWTRILKRIKR